MQQQRQRQPAYNVTFVLWQHVQELCNRIVWTICKKCSSSSYNSEMIVIIRRVTRRFDEIALHSCIHRACRAHQSPIDEHWFVVIFFVRFLLIFIIPFLSKAIAICRAYHICNIQKREEKTHTATRQVNPQSKRAQHRFSFYWESQLSLIQFQTVQCAWK